MSTIYESADCKMFFTDNNSLITIELHSTDYNEEKFDEFLQYFKNIWFVLEDKKKAVHVKLIIYKTDKKVSIPIAAYVKLIKVLVDLNKTFMETLHSMCIFTDDYQKFSDIYNLVLKMYNPPNKRPILFTQDESEIEKFFASNKLV